MDEPRPSRTMVSYRSFDEAPQRSSSVESQRRRMSSERFVSPLKLSDAGFLEFIQNPLSRHRLSLIPTEPPDFKFEFNNTSQVILVVKRFLSAAVTETTLRLCRHLHFKLKKHVLLEPEAAAEMRKAGFPHFITWLPPSVETGVTPLAEGRVSTTDVDDFRQDFIYRSERTLSEVKNAYEDLTFDTCPLHTSDSSDEPTSEENFCDCVQFIPKELLGTIVDMIVTIGGDGTVLWASHLFPNDMPPVLTIAMGSLGYLSQFTHQKCVQHLDRVFSSPVKYSLRKRLYVEVLNSESDIVYSSVVFNECVISRGQSGALTLLDVSYNGEFLTSVAADGLILATPTGSTAYSMSAGGPIVHPDVPCVLFTPVCPHTLSFRPLVLPLQGDLQIAVPNDARCDPWVAFDGRDRLPLLRGMILVVKQCAYPFPLILNQEARASDVWLTNIKNKLNWNYSVRQLGL